MSLGYVSQGMGVEEAGDLGWVAWNGNVDSAQHSVIRRSHRSEDQIKGILWYQTCYTMKMHLWVRWSNLVCVEVKVDA